MGEKLPWSWGWGCPLQGQTLWWKVGRLAVCPHTLLSPTRGRFIAVATEGEGERSPSEWGWVRRTGEEASSPGGTEQRWSENRATARITASMRRFITLFLYLQPQRAPSLEPYGRVLVSLTGTNCSGSWLTTNPPSPAPTPVTMVQFPRHS